MSPVFPILARLLGLAYGLRVKRKFSGLYARQPDPYAYDASPFEVRRRDAMLALLALKPDARVLEVGCAGGFITEALARASGRVTATDIAEAALVAARARLAAASLAGKAEFECRSLVDHEPEARAYDAIVVAEVLYYLGGRNALLKSIGADDALLDASLTALLRALKPGGRLLLAHSYPDGEKESRAGYAKRAQALGAKLVAEETLRSDAEDRNCLLSLLEAR